MRFRVRAADRIALLTDAPLVIGRAAPSELIIDNPSISRQHASLRLVGDAIEVIDLGSKNGTFVNGLRITSPVLVRAGVDLRVGQIAVVIEHASDKVADLSKTIEARPSVMHRRDPDKS